MKFHLTFFNGVKDNVVTTCEELDWSEFCWLLSHHTATDIKDTVMVCPARFRAGEGEAVRRCAANVIEYDMVALDIDGDYSISAFKAHFRRWTYAAYTTFSHRSPLKGGADAFRAFFPLAAPAAATVFRAMRHEIKSWAGIGDRSQLDLSRGFYLPSCPADRLVLAESWANEGEFLDWSDWAAAAADRVEAETALPMQKYEPLADDDRRRLMDKLKIQYVGNEPTWWKVGVAMAANSFSLADFQHVTLGGLMRQKTASDCANKWQHCVQQVRAGKQISIGYLYNVARGRF